VNPDSGQIGTAASSVPLAAAQDDLWRENDGFQIRKLYFLYDLASFLRSPFWCLKSLTYIIRVRIKTKREKRQTVGRMEGSNENEKQK
jgi:hypothetical protein